VIFKDLGWRSDQNKVVDLKKLCDFVVDNIFIWNPLSNENYVWFLKFKICIFQTTSDGETPKPEVVDLEKFCNFIVDNFSFEIIYLRKITVEFFHI
jgi:hypothetical protein